MTGLIEQVYGLHLLTKRYDDPIEVELASDLALQPGLEPGLGPGGAPGALRPLAFSWRGRRYAVQSLLKYWREAGEEWDPQRARDHECFRVEASDGRQIGVYDLRFDRRAADRRPAAPQWRLGRIWD